MGLKLANNALSRLSAGISPTDTSIVLVPGGGALFPTLGAGDYFPATIVKADGTLEIVKVTARASDVLTVARAQENTTAKAFNAGDRIELRLTASVIQNLIGLIYTGLSGYSLTPVAGFEDVPEIQNDDPLMTDTLNAQAQAIVNNIEKLKQHDTELADIDGADLVGAATYAQIRSYTGDATRIQCGGRENYFDRGHGMFVRTGSAADNDGTVLVDALGRSWVRQYDGVLQATWFGATGDGVTDDTAAIQRMLRTAYLMAPQTGWRRYTAHCHLPRGVYRVTQANALFEGLNAFSFLLTGDGGEGITEILYDVASPTSSDFLFNNDNLFGFAKFQGIRFNCKNGGSNQNFMNYRSTGTAQSLVFEDFRIDGFTNVFNVGNIANASENSLINGKITAFSGYGFKFNNTQSVNWRFFGVDAEGFTGSLFEYVQGATVAWYQGSIIPVSDTARVFKIPSDAVPSMFGPGNSPNLSMHDVRFELRNGALLAEKSMASSAFFAIFTDCGMGGFNIPDPSIYKAIKWQGAGSLTFDRCRNMQKYRIDHTTFGGTTTSELIVTVNNSDIPTDFVTASSFAISGGASNVGRRPLFIINDCGRALDGTYRPADSQVGSPGTNISIAQQKRAVTWSPEAGTLIVTAGSTQVVATPPVRLSQIDLYPTANAAYAGITATVTVRNGDGTKTLATFSYNMGSPAAKYTADISHYVDAMAGDTLQVTFAHSYTAGVALAFKGNMYFTY